jgi:hypothetical protein
MAKATLLTDQVPPPIRRPNPCSSHQPRSVDSDLPARRLHLSGRCVHEYRRAKRAKLLVLLGDIMTDGWREHDGNVDWDIKMARDLMIEFVGGEPAVQLRDQFAV